MDLDLRATAAGFLGAVAALGLIAHVVGVGDLLFALSLARLDAVAVLVAMAAVWVVAWALALRTEIGRAHV